MKKRKVLDRVNPDDDDDYVMYLNGNLSLPCASEHELSDDENSDDNDDPEYTLFLSRLEKDGSSYILKADESIGLTKSFKYEEDDVSDDVCQEDDVSDDVCQEDDDCNDVVQEDVMNYPVHHWTMSSDADENYALYCKNLRLSAHDDVIFCHESDTSSMYDCKVLQSAPKDNDQGHPSSIQQMSKPSFNCKKASSSSEEEKDSPEVNMKGKKPSNFRELIMEILRKPYDKEEHQKLWQDITIQKPQLRHIDLRSGPVRFMEGDKIGKSYLDYHGGLKRKVEAASRDDCKQLNLLRGFFFWIQYLTQEGSFIPWNDEECLAALPEA